MTFWSFDSIDTGISVTSCYQHINGTIAFIRLRQFMTFLVMCCHWHHHHHRTPLALVQCDASALLSASCNADVIISGTIAFCRSR